MGVEEGVDREVRGCGSGGGGGLNANLAELPITSLGLSLHRQKTTGIDQMWRHMPVILAPEKQKKRKKEERGKGKTKRKMDSWYGL